MPMRYRPGVCVSGPMFWFCSQAVSSRVKILPDLKRAMLDSGQWWWWWLHVKAWVVFVKSEGMMMEPMGRCTLTATLISRSSVLLGDLNSPQSNHHHHFNSQSTRPEREQWLELFVLVIYSPIQHLYVMIYWSEQESEHFSVKTRWLRFS